MILNNEFQPIRDWAEQRGIFKHGDVKTQFIKLQEEVGELAQAILKQDINASNDAIGDCVIVLTNLAHLIKLTQKDMIEIESCDIENCVNNAYLEIKNRTGKMENGTFKKQSQ